MHAWLALMLVAATPAPVPVSKALQLAAAKQWDELYLAYATAQPKAYSKADLPKLAKALAQGCVALLTEDAVMAFSLGEKSTEFAATAEGLYCTGLSGLRADQRGAAEEAFRSGVTTFPKDFRFSLELARLFATEGDAEGARLAAARIPKKAPEFEAAQMLVRSLGPRDDAPGPSARVVNVEPGIEPAAAPKSRAASPAPTSTGSLSYESSVDDEGRRVRANQYFRFRYFNAQRDFGQRAEYEGRVQGALDEARRAAERILGRSRSTPTDVILYSRQEFELHHGQQAAQAVAGFYSSSAIRMNDSADINPRNQATLVHEYVHAVVDEVSGFHDRNLPIWLNEGLAEYTSWQYQGREVPEGRLGMALKQQALQNQLPSLQSMSQGALIGMRNPALAYAFAALAVKVLVGKRGVRDVLELIHDCGTGLPFATAYAQRYGGSADDFDAEVAAELRH